MLFSNKNLFGFLAKERSGSILVAKCDVRLLHRNKDYLLTYLNAVLTDVLQTDSQAMSSIMPCILDQQYH